MKCDSIRLIKIYELINRSGNLLGWLGHPHKVGAKKWTFMVHTLVVVVRFVEGLIRRGNGSFVQGFFCNLGSDNALWAKLWASGLVLNWLINLTSAGPGGYLSMIQRLLWTMSTRVDHPMLSSSDRPLLQKIILLLGRPCWRTSVIHTYWEANRCADFLANYIIFITH